MVYQNFRKNKQGQGGKKDAFSNRGNSFGKGAAGSSEKSGSANVG